ncbi:MAG: hypothetical protein IJP62_04830 [Treponema sp.]|nr:hypothetical protein [Treponema sp.]
MKLEKKFEVKDGRLYKIGGDEVNMDGMAKTVKWSQVEPQDEMYDESFLAALRDELKNLEAQKKCVYIDAIFDRNGNAGQFTAAMKHCARRIKDCASVAGFSIPPELAKDGGTEGNAAAMYQEELLQKHQQYVFFCKETLADCVKLQ